MGKRLLMMLFAGVFAMFSTVTVANATDSGVYNTDHVYQVKEFSSIKSVNKFMRKHKGANLFAYDRKTEIGDHGWVNKKSLKNADEKYIVQYPVD